MNLNWGLSPNLLDDFGDGSADVVDILAVQSRYTHASRVGAIDAKLIAQTHHLVFGQA